MSQLFAGFAADPRLATAIIVALLGLLLGLLIVALPRAEGEAPPSATTPFVDGGGRAIQAGDELLYWSDAHTVSWLVVCGYGQSVALGPVLWADTPDQARVAFSAEDCRYFLSFPHGERPQARAYYGPMLRQLLEDA